MSLAAGIAHPRVSSRERRQEVAHGKMIDAQHAYSPPGLEFTIRMSFSFVYPPTICSLRKFVASYNRGQIDNTLSS